MSKQYYLDRLTAKASKLSTSYESIAIYYAAVAAIWAEALADDSISKKDYGEIINETHIKVESWLYRRH